MEGRYIGDLNSDNIFLSLPYMYKTNQFHVAVALYSNRAQQMPRCGKNIRDTLSCTLCAIVLFLLHFDVISNLLPNRCSTLWHVIYLLICQLWWWLQVVKTSVFLKITLTCMIRIHKYNISFINTSLCLEEGLIIVSNLQLISLSF